MLETNVRRVVLTGFMGSGKSTVGSLLAAELGWMFADVDQQIETTAGCAASLLFQTLGEAAFRDYEVSVMLGCMKATEIVIALGGAAVEHNAARELLSACDDCWVVFLDGPFETLIARCLLQETQEGATYRPLLREHDGAFARYCLRREWNERIAHQVVDVSVSTCQEITVSILERLRDRMHTLRRPHCFGSKT